MKHSLGLSFGFAEMRTDQNLGEDDELTHGSVFYDLQFDSKNSLISHYFEGDDIFGCLCSSGERRFEMQGFQLAYKRSVPLSSRWNFYARAGVTRYRTLFEGNTAWADVPLDRDRRNGFGQVIGAGFELKTFGGFILALETQWQTTANVDVLAHSVAMGYRF